MWGQSLDLAESFKRSVHVAEGLVKRLAHLLDELLKLGRRHGELAFLALADDGFGKGLFPGGRQRHQWQIAAR